MGEKNERIRETERAEYCHWVSEKVSENTCIEGPRRETAKCSEKRHR